MKRHGYYCRSQRINNPPKPQSCTFCARRKISCDKMKPECSRCKAKGIECQYGIKSAKTARKSTRTRPNASAKQSDMLNELFLTPSSFQNHLETNGDDDDDVTSGDSALVALETHVKDLSEDSINWDIPEIDFNEFLNPELTRSVHEPSPSWRLYADHVPTIDQIHSVNWSIPPQPTSNPRFLNQRPEPRPDVQRTTSLIKHTLKSYILTMLRQNALPPFIHQILTSTTLDMEALDNCVTLVHMISGGTRGSRKLFWKNVQMECERMCSEVGQDCYGSRNGGDNG